MSYRVKGTKMTRRIIFTFKSNLGLNWLVLAIVSILISWHVSHYSIYINFQNEQLNTVTTSNEPDVLIQELLTSVELSLEGSYGKKIQRLKGPCAVKYFAKKYGVRVADVLSVWWVGGGGVGQLNVYSWLFGLKRYFFQNLSNYYKWLVLGCSRLFSKRQ